ncbi:MAG: DNA repair protein RecO [Phocaeicola sp.]
MWQKTVGIVLRTLKYNDSSNVVEMYTQHGGRGSFLVSIPRSRNSVLKNVLFQPLSIVEFEANFKASSSLSKVKEAKSFYPFQSIPYDPFKSAIALFLAEFLTKALREESENELLFSYLLHSIDWLDHCKQNFSNFHILFLMRFTRFLGLYPHTKGYEPGFYFDLQAGSFTSTPPSHLAYINAEESSRIHTLMRMNYDTMHLFKMSRGERNRCLTLLNEYYSLHLPNFPRLKSLDILQELFS